MRITSDYYSITQGRIVAIDMHVLALSTTQPCYRARKRHRRIRFRRFHDERGSESMPWQKHSSASRTLTEINPLQHGRFSAPLS